MIYFFQRIKNALHAVFPIVGALRFGILGRKLTVIGITGTDGKSSSVILSAAMLRSAGHKVAHFSSVSYHDGDSEYPNDMKMTTPGHMQLHKFLNRALRNGCSHAVIEVTSQGILQHRHRLIGFSLVGITNITPEHIEAHNGFEQYKTTKISLTLTLLHPSNLGIVIDDEIYSTVQSELPKNVKIHAVKFGRTNGEMLSGTLIEESILGSALLLSRGSEQVTVHSKLGGPFAAQNILFAATIASLCGVQLTKICDAVEGLERIPGRFEIISRRPLVIVDYAHTLNALTLLLPYVRAHTSGILLHVFGAAGGGRDRYKRPLIAGISQKHADISILTEENSFDEPVERILGDIRIGFSESHPVYVIPRREDAIVFAKNLLKSPDDTLLLTAKGSETVVAGPKRTKRPYNERTYTQCLFETSVSA